MLSRTGLCVADCGNPLRTFDQLQGEGTVWNKALVIPTHLSHIQPELRSIEYVLVEPGASIGQHQQYTDEIYILRSGEGELWTNGDFEQVEAGSLVVAPVGTVHALRNVSATAPLDFLVIEMHASCDDHPAPFTVSLPEQLQPSHAFRSVRIGQHPSFLPDVASYNLADSLRPPWGQLCLVEVPAGGRIDAYALLGEEDLFLLDGYMTVAVEEQRFDSGESGLNIFIPRHLPHTIQNRSSAQPLRFLSIQFQPAREEVRDARK